MIEYVFNKRNVKLVLIGLDFGKEGYVKYVLLVLYSNLIWNLYICKYICIMINKYYLFIIFFCIFISFERYRFYFNMKLTRRFYLYIYNLDGFFVVKLKKFLNKILGNC